MRRLRKFSLMPVMFLGVWLGTAVSYSMQSVCTCCYPKESQHGCIEKQHTTPLSFGHENQQEDNHHHQEKNQCHKEDSDCFCTKCGNSETKETLLKVFLTETEKKLVLTPGQNIFERKDLLTEGIITYQEKKLLTKFIPPFLLNSSFLL